MKKTILILLAFVFIGCAQDKILKIVVDQYDNPIQAQNIKEFVFWKWSGDSASQYADSLLDSVGVMSQVILADSIFITTYFPMDKVIRAACYAADSLNRKSDLKHTRFYYPPEDPNVVKVQK